MKRTYLSIHSPIFAYSYRPVDSCWYWYTSYLPSPSPSRLNSTISPAIPTKVKITFILRTRNLNDINVCNFHHILISMVVIRSSCQ